MVYKPTGLKIASVAKISRNLRDDELTFYLQHGVDGFDLLDAFHFQPEGFFQGGGRFTKYKIAQLSFEIKIITFSPT